MLYVIVGGGERRRKRKKKEMSMLKRSAIDSRRTFLSWRRTSSWFLLASHPCSTKRVGTCIVRSVSLFDERFNRWRDPVKSWQGWHDETMSVIYRWNFEREVWHVSRTVISDILADTDNDHAAVFFSVGDRERKREKKESNTIREITMREANDIYIYICECIKYKKYKKA